jgi:hypothetical protein
MARGRNIDLEPYNDYSMLLEKRMYLPTSTHNNECKTIAYINKLHKGKESSDAYESKIGSECQTNTNAHLI